MEVLIDVYVILYALTLITLVINISCAIHNKNASATLGWLAALCLFIAYLGEGT